MDAVTPEPSQKPYVVFTGYDHLFETDINGRGQFSRDSFIIGLGGRYPAQRQLRRHPALHLRAELVRLHQRRVALSVGDINQYTLIGLARLEDQRELEHPGRSDPPLRRRRLGQLRRRHRCSAAWPASTIANKDLSLGLSLGVLSQLEDDPAIVPIPNIRWRFADALTFSTGITQLGGRTGLGPDLAWSINDVVDLGVGAQYQRRRFRLNDHGFNKKGIGEETSAPLYVRIAFHPVPEATLELFTGVAVAGELTIQDKDGNQTFDRGYDAAPMLGLRGEYRF